MKLRIPSATILIFFIFFLVPCAQIEETTSVDVDSLVVVDEDFEGNFPNDNWFEESEKGGYRWAQESYSNQCEKDNQVPTPPGGKFRHLRLWRCDVASSHFGVARLRSREFVASPGDRLVFIYWIRSTYLHFTNLQVSYFTGKKEKVLTDFSSDSTPENAEWRTASLVIPVETNTKVSITFYGFCGDDSLSGIAIDDIKIESTYNTGSPSGIDSTMTSSLVDNKPTTKTFETDPSITFSATTLIPTTTTESLAMCVDGVSYGPCDVIACGLDCSKASSMSEIAMGLKEITTKTYFEYVMLLIPANDSTIPENILGEFVFTTKVKLNCTAPGRNSQLNVLDNAFTSVSSYLGRIEILSCNLNNTTFSFMNGLSALNTINFFICTQFESSLLATTFPPLQNLKWLIIEQCTGVSRMTAFPAFSSGLIRLTLSYSNIGDEMMGVILNRVLECCAETLISLDAIHLHLTRIPQQIKLFQQLKTADFESNRISTLSSYSPLFSEKISTFFLDYNVISLIEPGAFGGNIPNGVQCVLHGNRLTRFESSAFQPLLEQMEQKPGIIYLEQNPFKCLEDKCHLAWLLRDNRQFLQFIDGATCADSGKNFEDIDEGEFSNCTAADLASATISP